MKSPCAARPATSPRPGHGERGGGEGSRARWLAGLLLAVAIPAAHADPVEQLRSFLAQTRSARGDFTQQQTGKQVGKALPPSRGHFEFQRPGRFRWVYEQPYAQTIVSDGDKLYVYDQDLNQVTIKHLQGALPASPASILFGSNAFERDFTVAADGAAEGIEWVRATPRARDSPYERIRIGFRDGLPAAMELADSFGQVTRLGFNHVQRNPALAAGSFRFEPPKGADVLQDP